MDDRRQTRSQMQLGSNESREKVGVDISLDEVMTSSKLSRYTHLLRGKGIGTVDDLMTMPREQLSQISNELPLEAKVQFEKLISEIRECFDHGNEDLKEFLHSIYMSHLYRLLSANKIRLDALLKFSKYDLKKLGMSEVAANILIIELKTFRETHWKKNIGSDVIDQDKNSPLVNKNLSYADVAKSKKDIHPDEQNAQSHGSDCSSSRLAMKFDTSPNVHSKHQLGSEPEWIEVGTKIQVQQNEMKSLSAEQFLKSIGIEITLSQDRHKYTEVIAKMDSTEQFNLACIAVDLALHSNKVERNESTTDQSQHLAVDDVEMLDVDEQIPVRQSASIEENIIPVATVEAVQVVRTMPRKALNILLLGQTGVGKSTFINAFANYVNHETLSEAKNKMLALIPSSFSVSDDDYVDHKVRIGSQNEQNECLSKDGQSSTQTCRSYVFPSKHGALRIIDTPGVGDTRGEDQDLLNFNNILSYISQYPELNAICILLNPNCARLTAGFRLCLIQLLNNLEKSASQNVIFVFTNARSTFYQPGDTKPVLEELLREIAEQPPYVKLKFDQSTSYCVDNESFRFLAAITNGLDFLNSAASTIEESWTISVAECKRLMDYILTLKPHNIQGTVSIIQARRLINDLSGPVADIILEMCLNMTRIGEQKDFLEKNRNSNESIESLKRKLKTKELKISYINLPFPRTVCASKNCVVIRDDDNVDYKICHDDCYVKLDVSERCGDPNLRDCCIFSYRGNGHCICKICNCTWREHMRITRMKTFHEVEKEDIEIQVLLQKVTTINQAIEAFDHQFASYEKEGRMLVEAMAFFTAFQNLNSITGRGDPFRDIFTDNLKIENYKNKRAHANNYGVITKLENFLQYYDEKKNKFVVEDKSNQSMQMTAENVFQYEQFLYGMPLNGAKLLALKSSAVNYDFNDAAEIVVELEKDLSRATILQSVDAYFLKQ